MKKTLLTVVMAGLATTTFANTSIYKTNTVNAYVDGELLARYSQSTAQVDSVLTSTGVQQNSSKTINATIPTLKNKTKFSQLRVRLGTGLDFASQDGLVAGYYLRLQTEASKTTGNADKLSEPSYKTSTDNTATATFTVKNTKKEAEKVKFGNQVELHRAYAYLGHKDFGTVTLGKHLPSVVDYAFDIDSNVLDGIDNTSFRELTDLKGTTVKYDLPKFGGFSAAYSFTNNSPHKDAKYSRLNAFHAQYDFGGTVLGGSVAFKKEYTHFKDTNSNFYASTDVYKKVNGFEVSLENTSLADGLYLGLAYDYVKSVDYNGVQQSTKKDTNEVSAKVGYEVNQYFSPYLVAAYNQSKESLATDKEYSVKTKGYQVLVGTTSNVYSQDSFNVKLYAEGAFGKVKSDSVKNTKRNEMPFLETANTKAKLKAFAVGLVASF